MGNSQIKHKENPKKPHFINKLGITKFPVSDFRARLHPIEKGC